MGTAVLGTEGNVCFAVEGFDTALSRAGSNTGNLLFQFAVWNAVRGPKFAVQLSVENAAQIRRNAGCLVIPAANQINGDPSFDLAPWADFVEALDLPTRVVGLGAQAPIGSEDLELNENVIRFAKAISARSQKIGVRGKFTQGVLARLGIENTVVAGCPTQLINRNLTGAAIRRQLDRVKEAASSVRIVLLGGTLQEGSREAEAALYRLVARYGDHIIVFQSNPSILRLLSDEEPASDDPDFLNWQCSILRPDLSTEQFRAYLFQRGRFYSSAPAWIDAMKHYDLAIGMRIHGAIAALEGGRLGVCVAFDSRTLELSETMGVPHFLASDIQQHMLLADVLDLVRFDADEFDVKRKRNLIEINAILDGLT